jgi:hypothetical protein
MIVKEIGDGKVCYFNNEEGFRAIPGTDIVLNPGVKMIIDKPKKASSEDKPSVDNNKWDSYSKPEATKQPAIKKPQKDE